MSVAADGGGPSRRSGSILSGHGRETDGSPSMTDLKKTLQDGTPAQVDAARPDASRHPSPPRSGPEASRQNAGEAHSAALPPAPTSDELKRSGPPEGRRTPDARTPARGLTTELPENATGWMLRARRMSLALEHAIRDGAASPTLEASIERAFAAWELDGSGDKRIAHVAGLIQNAHAALRDTAPADLERAYQECAQVLWAGLPRRAKSKQDLARVAQIVRVLRAEVDPWAAVVEATATIFGWTDAARAHAAQAVRVAILAERSDG